MIEGIRRPTYVVEPKKNRGVYYFCYFLPPTPPTNTDTHTYTHTCDAIFIAVQRVEMKTEKRRRRADEVFLPPPRSAASVRRVCEHNENRRDLGAKRGKISNFLSSFPVASG